MALIVKTCYICHMTETREFLLVVPDGGMLFEPTGVVDILDQANRRFPQDRPAYRVTTATPQAHRTIRGRSGLHLLADYGLAELDPGRIWDTIVVTNRAPLREQAEIAVPWLAKAAPRARRVVSVCAGALVLAEAGLLENRRATTHWQYFDSLERLSPTTEVDRDSIYVRDGFIWTSAGASSGFDLTLALVAEDLGAEIAREVAREMVLYLRRPGGQSQFSRFLAAQADPETPIGRVQTWALENLREDLSVERLADRAAMSLRNFCRVFAHETGTTPARFVEDLRLEAARQRLEQGRESLDEVASACGLTTALNLRRLFERHLGVSPADYRERFGMI